MGTSAGFDPQPKKCSTSLSSLEPCSCVSARSAPQCVSVRVPCMFMVVIPVALPQMSARNRSLRTSQLQVRCLAGEPGEPHLDELGRPLRPKQKVHELGNRPPKPCMNEATCCGLRILAPGNRSVDLPRLQVTWFAARVSG